MDSSGISIFSPCIKIRLYQKLLHTVHSDHIKFPDRFVILRWISSRYDQPPRRNLMTSECFTLKKLQHGRRQRLGHTVNLINKQDSLPKPGFLNFIINGGYDLTHGVFRNSHLFSIKFFLRNKRQANGTLPGMMSNGIRYQPHLALSGYLLHNLSLTDSRCSNKKNRALSHNRNLIFPVFIF